MNRLAALAVGLLLAAPASAETLADAIAKAHAGNPALAAARARHEAAAEAPAQARAAGLPTAFVEGGAAYDNQGYGKKASAAVSAALPVWTGGRVPAAVRAANADVEAGALALRDTEAALLEDVVSAYADLLYQQQAVEVARVGIARLERQLAEAQSRFNLGQATRTDVAQLDAQRASVVAALADAEGALASAAARYNAIVGEPSGVLSPEVPLPAGLPETLAEARGAADAANPLLLRQQKLVEAADARVSRERAERAPMLDLGGSYGRGNVLERGQAGYEAATAGVTLRLPLFTGGLVESRVRQARALWRAEQLEADAVGRDARRGADSAWAQLLAARNGLQANRLGLEAADLALRGVRSEYGFGLRTTLDILVADQSYTAAQLAVARSQRDLLMAQAALLRIVGRLTVASYG